MSRKTLLYYLFNKARKPLYVDRAGYVVPGTEDLKKQDDTPAHLQVSPDGWQNTLVKYARNIKYWGVFRDFTVAMRFVKDGSKILKWAFWRGAGVETVIHLGIAKLDKYNLPYNYLSWFVSELNFAKFSEPDRDTVVVEALEGGLSKYLKAFENTEYEVDISADPECVTVIMDGMEIGNAATFAITNGASVAQNANIGNHLLDAAIINKEIEDIGGVADVPRTRIAGDNPSVYATRLWAFKATAAGTIEVSWKFDVKLTYVPPPAINPAAVFRIQARIINPDSVNNVTKVITLEGWLPQELNGTTYHLAGSSSLAVVPGDELYFVGAMSVQGAGGDAQLEALYSGDEPTIDVKYTYRHDLSRIKGLRPKRLLEKLVAKISNNEYRVVSSSFLDNLREVVITSGDALRGNEPSVVKTSIAQFYKSFSRYMIGMGIQQDVLVLERLKEYFRDEVIMDLGEVGVVKLDVAEDLFFNTVKVGYNTQEYNGIAGKYEFNQGQQWSTAMTRIIKEFDLVSPYRADALGAELLRINFSKTKTTDSRADNDTWMLSVNPDSIVANGHVGFVASDNRLETFFVGKFAVGQTLRITGTEYNDGTYTVQRVVNYLIFETVWLQGAGIPLTDEIAENAHIEIITGGVYTLWRPAYSAVAGIPYPKTAFNTMLRPKLALIENSALIHSIMDLQEGTQLEFKKADKNAELVTTIGLQTITEKEAMQPGNMAPKLFRPYYLTFKTKVPGNVLQVLDSTPYGKIRFTSQGEVFYGYIFDGGVKPADNDEQQWKLLSAPENDLYLLNQPRI